MVFSEVEPAQDVSIWAVPYFESSSELQFQFLEIATTIRHCHFGTFGGQSGPGCVHMARLLYFEGSSELQFQLLEIATTIRHGHFRIFGGQSGPGCVHIGRSVF